MKSVLITGVAGMIGSHLADILLEKGHHVLGLDDLSVGSDVNLVEHESFKFINGSVLDSVLIENLVSKVDAVVHLATFKKGSNLHESRSTLRLITQSADIVLDAAYRLGKRVVLASTSDVYGHGTSFPFRESDPVSYGPFNTRRWAYATAKQYTEQLAFDYAHDGLDVRIIRYFGGFSERSCSGWQGGHLPIFIKRILENEALEIHGDGSQTRCVTYGADLALGTYLALITEDVEGELFNIGGTEEISVKDTALRIAEIAGLEEPAINYIDTKEIFGTYQEIQRRLPCLDKAKEMLGYEPQWSFEKGVKQMISAYKKQA
ncbi:NAD-dependent epimerase/dehydratase family protein [Neptuniibacter caesariensis]|uniref:Nucleoside-diphosphate-sugar epimerase (UDP-glucose 4-epimerase) n=1 Tax=Neptuniibacter caesariensis TaxID=207954 RepID=A0A7U8GRR7_NEPCE|nr:NAD-dependent epimerase/dehydratase family protein [Neptuniibacter caesariensis]EAR60523.1 nucleoside-diphosphate-sugar epimerase (UDP-glucose 4-epimerase) [Oceanospirillum sp. MED92] [Neptuniibacter caesariensis]